MEGVRRTVVLDASRAQVWRALTDGLSAWYGAEVTTEGFEEGSHLEFRWPDGTARAAVIEEVVPEQLLAFRWLPFARTADGAPVRRDVTRVELALSGDGDAVALLVVESAMDGRALAAVGGGGAA